MAGLSAERGPGELASLLESLRVRVESASVERRALSLPDYPGGPRPSSVLRLSGGGLSGFGENVAFVEREQERFAGYIARWLAARAASALEVRSALSLEGTPYERAALEAAVIDLALRQAGLSLFDLTGVREAPLRFVVSLAADPDPDAAIARLRAAGYHGDLKVDVDPRWDAGVLDALAQNPRIVIFDFKGRSEAALAERLYAAHPSAWFEDPPLDFAEPELGSRPSRISRDASLTDVSAVASASARGEAVNLKAPRMAGPLAVLRGLERAGTPSRAYLGGMFEVSVGRVQARQLAALYCATAPNDLALNVTSAAAARAPRAESPARIRLDVPGFGAAERHLLSAERLRLGACPLARLPRSFCRVGAR